MSFCILRSGRDASTAYITCSPQIIARIAVALLLRINNGLQHLTAGGTDIANRLTEDDAACYAYDANGNLTGKTAKVAGTCTGGVTDYTYDAQNQLTRIDFPDLTVAAYRYDGLGRRIEKDVNGAVTQYVYDGSAILLEYDGASTLLARYSHGQGVDQPLAVERGGQSYYYQADHQGSVRAITDSAGVAVNSYDYDAYGNIENSVEGIANPFTYTGRELDAESGLYYYRARYYDAATGRFLAEDPIGFRAGDANLYRYVFNNPVNLIDPSGLEVCKPEEPVCDEACLRERARRGQEELDRLFEEFKKNKAPQSEMPQPARDFLIWVTFHVLDMPTTVDPPRPTGGLRGDLPSKIGPTG